jgi:FtsZ-interacting cell division protein ZipA
MPDQAAVHGVVLDDGREVLADDRVGAVGQEVDEVARPGRRAR